MISCWSGQRFCSDICSSYMKTSQKLRNCPSKCLNWRKCLFCQVGRSDRYVRKVGQWVRTKQQQQNNNDKTTKQQNNNNNKTTTTTKQQNNKNNKSRFSIKTPFVKNCVRHCTLTTVEEVMSQKSRTNKILQVIWLDPSRFFRQ